jgi:DeoR/GlpR family transcriptional regulator of sugar metabolism
VLAQQRQAAILELVRETGAVRVADLVQRFGVSDMTVRRDLEALAGRGLVDKVHGGATTALPSSTEEPGFTAKSLRQRAEKAAIAQCAATLVAPGSAVALSAGTTTAMLASHLVEVPGLTVVTNSIQAADLLYRRGRADQTVIITGGTRTPSDALVGPVAEAAIAALNVDMLFLGVHGMSSRTGFSTPNLLEAGTNRLLIGAARRLIVLADHSKWQVIGIATIAALADADVVITDAGLPVSARDELEAHVGELVVVEADTLRAVEAGSDVR